MKQTIRSLMLGLGLIATLNFQLATTFAQGTSFTYQGRLSDNGSPANGIYDLAFAVCSGPTGLNLVSGILTNSATSVSNGLFTAALDFGAGVFDGSARWLFLSVRTNGGGAFTILSPRQLLTAAPYAITASNLTGTLPAAQLSGVVAAAQLPASVVTNGATNVNLAGAFSGNGGSLTNLSAANLAGTVPDARLSANVSLLGQSISSAEIIDGTIVNADIHPSAAIADTKLATITTAGKVANSATTASSSSTPNSIVARDASGNFAAGTIAGSFIGSGAGLTNVNLLNATPAWAITLATNSVGAFGFSLASVPLVGDYPTALVAADINGDGRVDLVSANLAADTLSVMTNNGSGAFGLASSPVELFVPVSVAAADVNGDGQVDLITAKRNATFLSVRTNDGSGAFVQASMPTFLGNRPECVITGDVNGDGKVDLITANGSSNSLSVLTNNGSGTFALASSPSAGNPQSLTVASVNGDLALDLIIPNETVNTVGVFLGTGTGTFVSQSATAVGAGPVAVAAADVNGDGRVDLISANFSGNTLSVLTNNGGGTFGAKATLTVGNAPAAVTAADVNGDGWVDLISANRGSDTLSVLTNNGTGGFVLAVSPAVGDSPTAVVAVDVNGDGAVDLVSANEADDTLTVLLNTLTAVTITATFQGNFTGSTLSVNGTLNAGHVAVSGFTAVAQTSFVATNSATLTPASGYVKISATSPVTLNATTAIADGLATGAMLILEGSSDVNTVTVPHIANTRLSAPHALGNRDILTLVWNGANWIEVSYADNN